MASDTKKTELRRKRRHRRLGHRRKAKQSQRSTLSAAELFAECGEPGQAAPATSSQS